jgi:ketosteroid isomerase-like protein
MADQNAAGVSLMRWGAAAMVVAGILLIALQPLADLVLLSHEDSAFSLPIPEMPGSPSIVGVIVLIIGALLMAAPFLPAGRPPTGVAQGRARQIIAKLENKTDDAFFEHVADDVEWTVIGPRSNTMRFLRKSEARARKTPLTALQSLGAQLRVAGVTVEGNRAAVELSALPRADDARSAPHDCCWILCFEEGMVIRVHEYDHGGAARAVEEAVAKKDPSIAQGNLA